MKKIVKPLVGALLAAAMLSSSVTVGAGTVTGTIEQQDAGESTSQITAADKPYLSLGADLTEDQKAYVEKLQAELADTMAMCGAENLASINRDMVLVK